MINAIKRWLAFRRAKAERRRQIAAFNAEYADYQRRYNALIAQRRAYIRMHRNG